MEPVEWTYVSHLNKASLTLTFMKVRLMSRDQAVFSPSAGWHQIDLTMHKCECNLVHLLSSNRQLLPTDLCVNFSTTVFCWHKCLKMACSKSHMLISDRSVMVDRETSLQAVPVRSVG